MKDHIAQIIKDLKDQNFDFSQTIPLYNPMEEFFKRVKEKEIVHSDILADLLREDGKHGLGSIFLKSFFKEFLNIDLNDVYYVKITRERPVQRVITEGSDRSIDIFIDYRNLEGSKGAIIIENKLNNASYKPKQLEDYYLAIRAEGYESIKIVCLHKETYSYTRDLSVHIEINPIILYPFHLADWIHRNLNENDIYKFGALYSYVIILHKLNCDNILKENMKVLLNLNPTTLSNIKILSETYSRLDIERFELIKCELTLKGLTLQFSRLGEYLQIKDDVFWNKYKSMFVVSKDGGGKNFLSVTRLDMDDDQEKELLSLIDYKRDDSDKSGEWPSYEYRWYEAKDISLRIFDYPENNGFNRLIDEIVRLVKIVHDSY
ncbi:MAG: PD-(D/E)XK nuclease family protein [Muribaculaceae bacterium]|nr:PD-(D/E)XK nuclease family protein [Muribaculaceae bacterium]